MRIMRTKSRNSSKSTRASPSLSAFSMIKFTCICQRRGGGGGGESHVLISFNTCVCSLFHRHESYLTTDETCGSPEVYGFVSSSMIKFPSESAQSKPGNKFKCLHCMLITLFFTSIFKLLQVSPYNQIKRQARTLRVLKCLQ